MTAMVLLSEWMRSQVEFWRPIPEYAGYDASSHGRIRSHRARNGRPLRANGKPRLLSSAPDRAGYLQVVLVSLSGIRSTKRVHQLIACAFLSRSGSEVNHRTALKSDNRVDNLEWSTRLLNVRHSFANGLVPRGKGEDHPMAILTETQVLEIKSRLRAGEGGSRLAREFGVTKYAISDIKIGKTWTHLE